jgi:hypothetical protein
MIAYKNNGLINSLPCMDGGCPKNKRFSKVERSGIWTGLGMAAAAFVMTIINWLSKHTGN